MDPWRASHGVLRATSRRGSARKLTPMQAHASPLLIDLYELTMAQAYFDLGMHDSAVFELFVRTLPRERRFLVTAGLAQTLEYLEHLRFASEDIDFLQGLGLFSREFLSRLAQFRFTGSVHAMPEGTPFFGAEPILRITAPILEAQLVESRILNIMHFQTVVASKAARCTLAGRGKHLVDFGMRRAHEADAALYAARAAYLGGFEATATVAAGREFGIPLSGTMAHSFIEAHDDELSAFRRFVATYPEKATLLIDTYEVERAAQRVAALATELRAGGERPCVRAVRIDSGDLAHLSRLVRDTLDEAGCEDIQIVVSGGLDEHGIEALLGQGAPVDAFGIGTALDVAVDAPALDMAYKLQEYAGRARRKRSTGKATWPGVKQVYRERERGGAIVRDRVALATDTTPGEALLVQVMQDGRRLNAESPLAQLRAYCLQQLQLLPDYVRELTNTGEGFPVLISASLRALAAELDAVLM